MGGILIAIVGFASCAFIFWLFTSLISKATGMGFKNRGKSISHPDDFDNAVKQTKAVFKTGSEKVSSQITQVSKSIKGSYKHYFDEIQKLNLTFNYPKATLQGYIDVCKKLENLKNKQNLDIDEQVQAKQLSTEYVKYRGFLQDTDFKKYFDLLSMASTLTPELSVVFVDRLGIENSKSIFDLLNDIDRAYWRNDLTKDEKDKLLSYFRKEVLKLTI